MKKALSVLLTHIKVADPRPSSTRLLVANPRWHLRFLPHDASHHPLILMSFNLYQSMSLSHDVNHRLSTHVPSENRQSQRIRTRCTPKSRLATSDSPSQKMKR